MSKSKPSCPWYKTALEKLGEKRDSLYKKWKESGHFEDELKFKEAKAIHQRKVRRAKEHHVDKVLSFNTNLDDYEDHRVSQVNHFGLTSKAAKRTRVASHPCTTMVLWPHLQWIRRTS